MSVIYTTFYLDFLFFSHCSCLPSLHSTRLIYFATYLVFLYIFFVSTDFDLITSSTRVFCSIFHLHIIICTYFKNFVPKVFLSSSYRISFLIFVGRLRKLEFVSMIFDFLIYSAYIAQIFSASIC